MAPPIAVINTTTHILQQSLAEIAGFYHRAYFMENASHNINTLIRASFNLMLLGGKFTLQKTCVTLTEDKLCTATPDELRKMDYRMRNEQSLSPLVHPISTIPRIIPCNWKDRLGDWRYAMQRRLYF